MEESVGKLHTLLTVLCNLPGELSMSTLCVGARAYACLSHLLLSVISGAIEDSWDPQSVSPWWQLVRNTCIQSQDAAAAALLAALVAHCAAKASIACRADSKVPLLGVF